MILIDHLFAFLHSGVPREFNMVVQQFYIPGRDTAVGEKAIVCFADLETDEMVLHVMTSLRELIGVIQDHTFTSHDAAGRFFRESDATTLPEVSSTPLVMMRGLIPGIVNHGLEQYAAHPEMHVPPRKRWGAYLATNLVGMIVYAYVDRQGTHHIAYFIDYPSVEHFCVRTHVRELDPEHLAPLLVGGETHLPRKQIGAACFFHGTLAYQLAEGVRIFQAMYRAPEV
jgi:hypothetical protein